MKSLRLAWVGLGLFCWTLANAMDWEKQVADDAKQDVTTIAYDGQAPNKMVCDTTLRELPDGSWVLLLLAGDDFEPSPRNYIGITRSTDRGTTWSPVQPVDTGFPREGTTSGQGPTELLVRDDRCTLFFSTHSQTWGRDWKSWMMHSTDACRTWSKPEPVPGRLASFTFIRNSIVTRDDRVLAPFQHYLGPGPDVPPPAPDEKPWHASLGHYVSNPRNGVLMSSDGGRTWIEHGNVRLTDNGRYHGWAENNIVELADGRIAMIIRGDRLGGVLYYAESRDGGRTWPEFAQKTEIPNPGSKATLYPLGGDAVALLHNPNPTQRSPLALWISHDGMKTWPYRRVLVPESCDGPKGRLNYPDGFVSKDRQWLHFAFDDNRHRAVYCGAKLPPLVGGPLSPATPKPAGAAADPALVPPAVNLAPGPEYADETRIFQGIPGLERAANGRLWALWYAGGPDEPGEGPGNYVVLVTSGDDGKSWSKPKLVLDPPGAVRAYDPCLWHDPQGKLWLFWAQSHKWWDGRSGVWAIVSENSGDETPRWSAPRRLCDGIMMNKPTALTSGEWLFPAAVWQGKANTDPAYRHDLGPRRGANVMLSADRGETVSFLGQALVPKRVFDEHSIIERRDGSLWMLVRAAYGIGESVSTDRGKTWSAGAEAPIPHVNSRFFITRLRSGKLLLVTHNPPDKKTRSHLTARLSDDDGKSWAGGLLIDERAGISYPDGVQAPDGTVYLIYDFERTGAKQILMAAFTETDVAQGRWGSEEARQRVVVNQATGSRNSAFLDMALQPVPPNTTPGPEYSEDVLDYAMVIGMDRTPKGRLWAAWVAGGDSDKGFFVAASSDDSGANWSKPRLVIDPTDAPNGLRRRALVGNFWADPTGRLWLFYDQSMGYYDGRAGVWAITCDTPDADKPEWSAPRRIWHGATLNKPLVLKNGEWLLPISLWPRDKIGPAALKDAFHELDDQRMAHVFASTDRGRAWTRRGGVRIPKSDFDEHTMVELRDGRLWLLARTVYGVAESFSPDAGQSWSEPQPSRIKHTNARLHLRRLASGKLLLVKHGRIDERTPQRSHLTAFLSDDDGQSWSSGLMLDERTGVSYPDGFQAPDGTIFIIYDRNRAKDREILMARFSEGDVVSGTFQSAGSQARLLVHKAAGKGGTKN